MLLQGKNSITYIYSTFGKALHLVPYIRYLAFSGKPSPFPVKR